MRTCQNSARITLLFSSCPRIQLSQVALSQRYAGGKALFLSELQTAGKEAGLEGKSHSDTVGDDPHHSLAPLMLQRPLFITFTVRKHKASSPNERLIKAACRSGGRQTTFSLVIPAQSPPVLSQPRSLFYLCFCVFFLSLPLPPTPLRPEENKGRDRRKATQPFGPDLRCTPEHTWPQTQLSLSFEGPRLPLISAQRCSVVTDAQLSVCHSDTRLCGVVKSN